MTIKTAMQPTSKDPMETPSPTPTATIDLSCGLHDTGAFVVVDRELLTVAPEVVR